MKSPNLATKQMPVFPCWCVGGKGKGKGTDRGGEMGEERKEVGGGGNPGL